MTHTSTEGERARASRWRRGWRPLATLLTVSLAGLGLAALPAAQAQPAGQVTAADEPRAADQVLTWTADNDLDSYESAPVEAVAGPATLVFENSEATGNTTGMAHTLTFDVSNSEYNNDVRVNILANPNDANDGRHEVEVELTPGTYRYFCTIPGHLAMQGTLVVTEDGGGGGEDTTPPEVTAEVTGEQDADGAYVGSATVELTATDDDSGVESIEYAIGTTAFAPYEEPVVLDEPGSHRLTYRATDVAGNVSASQTETIDVVEGSPGGEDDTTPPRVTSDVTIEVAPATDPDGALTGMTTVELAATDEESEVASIEYAVGDGEVTTYTEPFMVHELGETTLTYRATDTAGNVSDDATVTFTVVAAEAPAHH